MTAKIGSADNPLRVAVIGAGPAGFYTVASLLKSKDIKVAVDLYDRLPTPFGLVRAGVAPDHQKDKSVTRVYDRSGTSPDVCFYGGIEYGSDFNLDELKALYHQIVFTTGASIDRSLHIPGENLAGSHSATEMVAWYNGHPDFADRRFDLSGQAAVIVGIGNVALDVARMLSKDCDELAKTDIADYALEALGKSNIRDIYVLGRRGPAQAAFTPPEIKELAELGHVDFLTRPEETELDALSQAELERLDDKNARRNVELIQQHGIPHPTANKKHLHLRFWVSPTTLHGDETGAVRGLTLCKNKPVLTADKRIMVASTKQEEYIETGLVFRSVGYQGMALPDLPFDAAAGTIAHDRGRVEDGGKAITGLYTAGWIKRGPTGVIGSNKVCARETVERMLEDIAKGQHLAPEIPSATAARQRLADRHPQAINYNQWLAIDAKEIQLGKLQERVRVKFFRVQDMLAIAENS